VHLISYFFFIIGKKKKLGVGHRVDHKVGHRVGHGPGHGLAQVLYTPAFESLYGGQFTLSTQLIKPNYLFSEDLGKIKVYGQRRSFKDIIYYETSKEYSTSAEFY